MAYRKILSIDGGGIRGVIPARLLVELEARTGKRCHELFDLITGTSTGGIIAVGLVASGRPGSDAPMTAQELLDLYTNRGHEIFNRTMLDRIENPGGLFDEMYSAKPIESILEELLGESELKDTMVDIVVTSYDIEARGPYLFKTLRARTGIEGRNHLLRDVARSTSAAPTYFPPFLLDRTAWEGEGTSRRVLVDGGVFANNPSMIGFAEALTSGSTNQEVHMLSLGTGVHTEKLPYDKAKDWGKLGWVVPVISVMMDGQSDATDFQLNEIFRGSQNQYLRMDGKLPDGMDALDNVSPENIANLQEKAEEILTQNSDALDAFIETLDV